MRTLATIDRTDKSRHDMTRILRLRRVSALVTALLLLLTGAALLAPAARADTTPDPGTPATVSADALPTWQINGVVWSQVVVGNVVYATGSFTQARPPGVAAGGAGSVTANNFFAYNITTGAPVAGFQHSLNAQGLVVKASPDGSRVYVGGDFTSVDGAARGHVVAINTATGAIDASFAATLGGQIRGIAASNSTVYVGGNFFSANGKSVTRLAAFNAANGTKLDWAPTADDGQVQTMVLSPDGSRVIVGGRFTTLNGTAANGMGAVDATSGATLPFAANQLIQDGGDKSSILGLTTDGINVYGSGFAFGTGNFEGSFAVNPTTGNVVWANDCHGDTYDTFPNDSALYTVSHAHDCRWIGAFPQTDANWSINMRHALAFSKNATGTGIGPDNYGWNFDGVPVSSLLQWFPTVAIGSYTGQSQAAWSVAGNNKYVVLGGEFPRVNGTAQQGLVRFATADTAPNKRGPVSASGAPSATALSLTSGTVRVAWQAAYDMDNEKLTYAVYRTGKTDPVYTTTQKSNYWTYPMMGYVDRGLIAGAKYNYTIKISDPFGNTKTLTTNQVTVGSGTTSAYANDVTSDGASAYWRLGEPSGSTAYDYAGFNDATVQGGVSRGDTGAIQGDGDTASTFSGRSDGYAVSSAMDSTPSFTIETWVKTRTGSGGKIVGYGNSTTGDSSSYDRHLYMDNAGHLIFGVYPGGVQTVQSSGTYNDGDWHYVVATLSSTKGMALYVDGKKVASNAAVTSAQSYAGYWRIGGDNLNGWPSTPSSSYLQGTIDDVAIYPAALSLAAIQQHYADSGRSLEIPTRPTDSYGAKVYDDSPDLYWRLDETSGTSAKDASPNGNGGMFSGGYTLGQPGGVQGTPGTSVKFDGRRGTLASESRFSDPMTYSEELWFKTTTTSGGKLIGFGDAQSGNSSNYDRHVYMENSGQLTFGVWTGTANTITSPKSYNDGTWHYLVATQSSDGMALYVDGSLVGTNPQTDAQNYSGYWRVGGDTSWAGSSNYFNGSIDEVAVYSQALSQATITSHYGAGGGTVPNQPPAAAFDSSASFLKLSVDGSDSSDADGTVVSYDWNWGDGSSHDSGRTASHAYDVPGTYTVTLTVTDNDGATGTVSHDVTVVPNQAPQADFAATTTGRTTAVDASASSDPDGTIVSYDWDWGDGSSQGSGKTASHTYAPGTYTITLTVTDDAGASATKTRQVSLTADPVAFAQDTFNRTVNGGWGNADVGGAWSPSGAANNFAVANGRGTITLASTGAGPSMTLPDVSSTDTDFKFQFGADKAATGGGTYITAQTRVTGQRFYFATARLLSTGGVGLILGDGDETLSSGQIAGLSVAPGERLNLRFQTQGTSPTTLRAKVWKAGTEEPTTWARTLTDATPDLQGPGAVRVRSYLSGSSTNAPVVTSFSALSATTPE